MNMFYKTILVIAAAVLSGCTTVTIDEYRHAPSEIAQTEAVVVIGRRSASDYETEHGLVSCVGDVISKGEKKIRVIPENEFVDKLYPWFEPRVAPLRPSDLNNLLQYDILANVIEQFNIRYFIWVDGSTETTRSSGGMNCSLAPGATACFGFGSWDKEANYEAAIWDYKKQKMIGKVNGKSEGTSYMPAFVVPIPIIAPVQGDVCTGLGQQLRKFFKVNG